MNTLKNIIKEIKKAKRIAVFHHIAPDGDSLGSALALREILEQVPNVQEVDNVITNYVPDVYKFLPNAEKLKRVDDESLYSSYDLAIAVDCASKERLGKATRLFNDAKSTISIDHHVSNDGFADIDMIDISASAAGEVVFKLIEPLNVKITPGIASNLYTAMLTDTGGFKFANTKPETLRICAKLIEAGADPVKLYANCFEIKPLEMVKLQARVVDRAIFAENNKIAYGVITRALFDELNAKDDYVDGITETLRQITSVEVALVFKETLKGTTKVSFRSNGMDVCKIANYFGGGGHRPAAGCLIEKGVEETIQDVMTVLVKEFHKQNKQEVAK